MTHETRPRRASLLAAGLVLLALPGCVSTAAKIVTAPVRIVGKTADVMTTSQSEADEKRGREMRERDERLGKLRRSYDQHRRRCDAGDEQACAAARREYREIDEPSRR